MRFRASFSYVHASGWCWALVFTVLAACSTNLCTRSTFTALVHGSRSKAALCRTVHFGTVEYSATDDRFLQETRTTACTVLDNWQAKLALPWKCQSAVVDDSNSNHLPSRVRQQSLWQCADPDVKPTIEPYSAAFGQVHVPAMDGPSPPALTLTWQLFTTVRNEAAVVHCKPPLQILYSTVRTQPTTCRYRIRQ